MANEQFTEELTQELTYLATNHRQGFLRFTRALKQVGVQGIEFAYCAYGFIANATACTDLDTRRDASEALTDRMRALLNMPFLPLEMEVIEMMPGKPLTERGLALHTLCKHVIAETRSLVATGSEQ
jgi:hypothetical protein